MRSIRLPAILLALTLPSVVLATGFGDSDAPTRIPVPARVFQATITDLGGVEVQVTRVSFNGEVSIYGNVGEGQVSVPFEKVAEVRIEPTQLPDKRVALVRTHTGESIKVTVDSETPWYGDTSFGHYRINNDKVRKVVITSTP